jgi:plasmid stabilization system protein ParE
VPKKYRVDITATAEADASAIWDYIAEDNPDAATAFVLRLEEQIRSLECCPERCSLVPENELLGTAYRHLLHGNYRTIFRIAGTRVIVVRIIHGARLLNTEMLEE